MFSPCSQQASVCEHPRDGMFVLCCMLRRSCVRLEYCSALRHLLTKPLRDREEEGIPDAVHLMQVGSHAVPTLAQAPHHHDVVVNL